jgi:APA family basic amino acid/polyamine antiporter
VSVTDRDFKLAEDSKSYKRFVRVLGFRDLVFLFVGAVIGSGIFLVPGSVLKQVGNSAPLALSVWLVGGLLSLLGALTYGELAAMNPEAGGLYVYIRDCFGPFLAFLFGWTLFFVTSSGSIATLAVAFSNYLAEFIPMSPMEMKAVSVLLIAVIAAVNVRGTRHSAHLQNVTTVFKIAAILAMSAALLWLGKHPVLGAASPPSNTPASSAISGFGLAMISVLWAYEGWQYTTFSAGEVVDPQRHFSRAFLAGSLALIGIYVLANYGYLAALGPTGVSQSNRVAATALSTVIGPTVAKMATIVILISMLSALNSILLTSPRVYFAMANDGLFFRNLVRIHPRFGTPALAITAAAIWSAVLAASGTFDQLLTYVIFISWIFYALAAGSIFIYRFRHSNVQGSYHVPGYPFTPLLFIVAAAALVINTVVREPLRAAVGIGIVLLGTPAYFIWRRLGEMRAAAANDVQSSPVPETEP